MKLLKHRSFLVFFLAKVTTNSPFYIYGKD